MLLVCLEWLVMMLVELVVEHGVVVVVMGPLAAPAVEDGVQLPS